MAVALRGVKFKVFSVYVLWTYEAQEKHLELHLDSPRQQ